MTNFNANLLYQEDNGSFCEFAITYLLSVQTIRTSVTLTKQSEPADNSIQARNLFPLHELKDCVTISLQ